MKTCMCILAGLIWANAAVTRVVSVLRVEGD